MVDLDQDMCPSKQSSIVFDSKDGPGPARFDRAIDEWSRASWNGFSTSSSVANNVRLTKMTGGVIGRCMYIHLCVCNGLPKSEIIPGLAPRYHDGGSQLSPKKAISIANKRYWATCVLTGIDECIKCVAIIAESRILKLLQFG